DGHGGDDADDQDQHHAGRDTADEQGVLVLLRRTGGAERATRRVPARAAHHGRVGPAPRLLAGRRATGRRRTPRVARPAGRCRAFLPGGAAGRYPAGGHTAGRGVATPWRWAGRVPARGRAAARAARAATPR